MVTRKHNTIFLAIKAEMTIRVAGGVNSYISIISQGYKLSFLYRLQLRIRLYKGKNELHVVNYLTNFLWRQTAS